MNSIEQLLFNGEKYGIKEEKGQFRILGNGPELADKLASILPKNILIRLVDTASLHMRNKVNHFGHVIG